MGLGNLKAGPEVGPGNRKDEICLVLEKWDFGSKIKWEKTGNRRVPGNLCGQIAGKRRSEKHV